MASFKHCQLGLNLLPVGRARMRRFSICLKAFLVSESLFLSKAQYRHQRYIAALATYDEIIKLDPSCGDAWIGKGKALNALEHISNLSTGVKICEHQEDAYDTLVEIIRCHGAKKAVLVQYSCRTSLKVLRMLVRVEAEVTLYIQHEETAAKIGSQFQVDRITYLARNLRQELGKTLKDPEKLKVFKYCEPSSMNVIKIDDRILYTGWYTYEHREPSQHEGYPNDTIEVSGHDKAALITWKGISESQAVDHEFTLFEGTDAFDALDKTFSVLEESYQKSAERVYF